MERLFFSQRHGDLLGSNGQFPEPFAGCPVDGVGNGRAGGVDDDLADGLGAEGTGRFIAVLKLYLQPTHVQTGGYLVRQPCFLHEMLQVVSWIYFSFLLC